MTSFITPQLTSTAKPQHLLCPIIFRTELSQATQHGTSSAFAGCSRPADLSMQIFILQSSLSLVPILSPSTILLQSSSLVQFLGMSPSSRSTFQTSWKSACTTSASQNGYLNGKHITSFYVTPEITGLLVCWTNVPSPPNLNCLPIPADVSQIRLVFTSSAWSENANSTLSQWPPN